MDVPRWEVLSEDIRGRMNGADKFQAVAAGFLAIYKNCQSDKWCAVWAVAEWKAIQAVAEISEVPCRREDCSFRANSRASKKSEQGFESRSSPRIVPMKYFTWCGWE